MLVTRPTHRGSGIALLVETSNAEAHADMYINECDANNRQGLPAYNQSDITYPWTSTVALNLTNNSKLPDFYVSRTKRQVNAFHFVSPQSLPIARFIRFIAYSSPASTFPLQALNKDLLLKNWRGLLQR